MSCSAVWSMTAARASGGQRRANATASRPLPADAAARANAANPGPAVQLLRPDLPAGLRDRVPRVLRRERLGHGPSGDIADHYTHIDDEMISDLLTSQTQRWEAAVAARARIDESQGREPRSAVPGLGGWLAAFRDRS
jgi:hypothetical protein